MHKIKYGTVQGHPNFHSYFFSVEDDTDFFPEIGCLRHDRCRSFFFSFLLHKSLQDVGDIHCEYFMRDGSLVVFFDCLLKDYFHSKLVLSIEITA